MQTDRKTLKQITATRSPRLKKIHLLYMSRPQRYPNASLVAALSNRANELSRRRCERHGETEGKNALCILLQDKMGEVMRVSWRKGGVG